MDSITARKLTFLRSQYSNSELEARLGISPKSHGRTIRLWLAGPGASQQRNISPRMLKEIDRVYKESSGFVDITAESPVFSPEELIAGIYPVLDEVSEYNYKECIQQINFWIMEHQPSESTTIYFDINPYLRRLSVEKRIEFYARRNQAYVGLIDMRSSLGVLRITLTYLLVANPSEEALEKWINTLLTYVGPGAYIIRDRRLRGYLRRWAEGEIVEK